MTDPLTTILGDGRTITAIFWPDDTMHRVGEFGVTEIKAYGEPGHYALVPWFAVYKGDALVSRVPADQVAVWYVPLS